MVTRTQVENADDCDPIVISGADLKTLLHYAQMFSSGLSPRGEMCFLYGKTLYSIVERAETML